MAFDLDDFLNVPRDKDLRRRYRVARRQKLMAMAAAALAAGTILVVVIH